MFCLLFCLLFCIDKLYSTNYFHKLFSQVFSQGMYSKVLYIRVTNGKQSCCNKRKMFCFKIIFLIILFLYRKEKSHIDNQLVTNAKKWKIAKQGFKIFG